ncbi:MAG: hypothetical protein ACFCU3_02320 [Verrucomicrobiales bacterium]
MKTQIYALLLFTAILFPAVTQADPSREGIDVLHASYRSDHRSRDVTWTVHYLLNVQRSREFVVSPDNLGDPDPGRPKVLEVRYRNNGRNYEARLRDGEVFQLQTPSARRPVQGGTVSPTGGNVWFSVTNNSHSRITLWRSRERGYGRTPVATPIFSQEVAPGQRVRLPVRPNLAWRATRFTTVGGRRIQEEVFYGVVSGNGLNLELLQEGDRVIAAGRDESPARAVGVSMRR